MRLPTSKGHRALRMIVRKRAETFTITRPTEGSGAMGGTSSESTHEADVFVFAPSETSADTQYGDRYTGALGGLALPTEDVEKGDRLTYQNVPYEVAEVSTSDDVGDTLVRLSFERRTND